MNNPQQQILNNMQNVAQLQNDVHNLTQMINGINIKLNQINNQVQQNVRAQISNGLDDIAKQDIKGNENQEEADNKRRDFVRFRNIQRRINGLSTLNYVVCKICRQVNAHYTNYCPKQLCKICLTYGHATKSCSEKFKCQACGETGHPTSSCKTNEAIALRAERNRVYWRCGIKGHIAMNCDKANAGFRPRSTGKYGKFNRSVSRGKNKGRGRFQRSGRRRF
jgi:hypothetical protein